MMIEVDKKIFNLVKNMGHGEFNTFLKNRFESLRLALDENSVESLEAKKQEIMNRLTRITEELAYLTEFCEEAEKDKKLMEEWIEKLDEENEEMLREMKE